MTDRVTPGPDGDAASGDAASGDAASGDVGPAHDAGPAHLRRRLLDDVERGTGAGGRAAERAAGEMGRAAQTMALGVVPTGLEAEGALVGQAVGMHLCLPAGHFHGPREAPALLYLFADALAVRPTDDAPMSTVPVLGLHMVLPPLAIARWVYKAGRIEHANLDLVKEAERFAASLASWTVDDFADADPKVQVHRAADLRGPVHVYEHLGFAHVWVPEPAGRPLRLKSALPVTAEMYVKLWQLFSSVTWPSGLRADVPPGASEEAPEEATGEAPEEATGGAPEEATGGASARAPGDPPGPS